MSTSVLKVKIHCEGCGRKVKKLLKKIPSVSSVTIDADQGRVTIVATVDPHTLIAALDKAGLKAELIKDNSLPILKDNNLQIVVHSKPGQSVDQRMVAQLHQLSEIEDLQNVEVTYSKSVKLSFKGLKDDPFDKDNNKTVSINGPQIGPSGSINGPQLGLRGTCCGHVMSHGSNCCGGHLRVCSAHNPYGTNNGYYWAPPPCGFTPPPPPPPSWWRDLPSAPLAPSYDPTVPPQPVAYPSYPYVYNDEKPNFCKFM